LHINFLISGLQLDGSYFIYAKIVGDLHLLVTHIVFDRVDVGVVLLRGNVDEFVLDHTAHKNSVIQIVM